MNLDWQSAAVLLLVAVACAYLARRTWLTMARRKAAACGSCSTCPSNAAGLEPAVVALGESAETANDGSPRPAGQNGARRPQAMRGDS